MLKLLFSTRSRKSRLPPPHRPCAFSPIPAPAAHIGVVSRHASKQRLACTQTRTLLAFGSTTTYPPLVHPKQVSEGILGYQAKFGMATEEQQVLEALGYAILAIIYYMRFKLMMEEFH